MDRRNFLRLTAATAISAKSTLAVGSGRFVGSYSEPEPSAYTVIPVVGDGFWIWNQPPNDQTGYLEPRTYELEVGIDVDATGSTYEVMATTPLPVACPEQKLDEERLEASACQADVRQLAPYSRQLVLAASELAAGQTAKAVAKYKLTLHKQYLAYQRDQFVEKPLLPADVRQAYLGDSTGIQTRAPQVRSLVRKLADASKHPWDLAERFRDWVRSEIKPLMGPYTSVIEAIENRRGDCEEMSAVFVALCRASGIAARLVWVPNHNWAEFYAADENGKGHWVPVHTACYHWFGWTGAHELVLQKGDRIRAPEKPTSYRLVKDWLQWQGRKPQVRYWATLAPLPSAEGKDPGPGARRKIETGEWQLVGTHPLDKYMRR